MQKINAYDSAVEFIEYLAEQDDTTTAEIIDEMIDTYKDAYPREHDAFMKTKQEKLMEQEERKEAYVRPLTPFERTRNAVYATGNKWAIENFNATHY